ncbi:hypothetical protein BOTBODRAFT_177277 [Botryobasidium botryosum FD-172 SS1]|uniref:Uncharacterized protein n=1 Tax=Botryobasidium botryosum (strain FD-172 SS1) TaxID=930990 RepID=A0A067MHT2_BOTB1|nr:hypothetical protein BOTBODRAFT_177277 [Botryobasidium botryosum FD-172 SS1]
MVGAYLHRLHPVLFEAECPPLGIASSVTTSQRTSLALRGSSAPASLPGDGTQNTSWETVHYLPPGFRWLYLDHCNQRYLRAAITLTAFQPPFLEFEEFVDELYRNEVAEGAPFREAYDDYTRLAYSLSFYSEDGINQLLSKYQLAWGHCIHDRDPSEDGFESDDTHYDDGPYPVRA